MFVIKVKVIIITLLHYYYYYYNYYYNIKDKKKGIWDYEEIEPLFRHCFQIMTFTKNTTTRIGRKVSMSIHATIAIANYNVCVCE